MDRTWLQRRAEERRRTESGLKRFLMGNGLPGYLSAVSAVVAVLLAVSAYSAWKTQEAAKRKADVALEALKAAYSADLCYESTHPNFVLDVNTDAADTKEEVERIVK